MNILERLKTYYKILVYVKKLREVFMNTNNNEKKTELFLTIGTILVNLVLALQGLIPATLMAQILAILTGIYTLARTIVKITKTTKDDEILNKIEQILKEKGVDINRGDL